MDPQKFEESSWRELTACPITQQTQPQAALVDDRNNKVTDRSKSFVEDITHKLFIHAVGVNSGKETFPQHVWVAFLETPDGSVLWSNANDAAEAMDGSQADALHTAVRASVPHIPHNSTVLLFAPQSQIAAIYGVSREVRRQTKYKGSNKKRRPNADIIMQIDNMTEARGITFIVREPEEHHEYDMLDLKLKEEAATRWEAAGRAASEKF